MKTLPIVLVAAFMAALFNINPVEAQEAPPTASATTADEIVQSFMKEVPLPAHTCKEVSGKTHCTDDTWKAFSARVRRFLRKNGEQSKWKDLRTHLRAKDAKMYMCSDGSEDCYHFASAFGKSFSMDNAKAKAKWESMTNWKRHSFNTRFARGLKWLLWFTRADKPISDYMALSEGELKLELNKPATVWMAMRAISRNAPSTPDGVVTSRRRKAPRENTQGGFNCEKVRGCLKGMPCPCKCPDPAPLSAVRDKAPIKRPTITKKPPTVIPPQTIATPPTKGPPRPSKGQPAGR